MKTFNTAGPCVPADHYMVPIAPQFEQFKKLIDNKRYFILHAPRQTGKTTLMLQLMKHLNEEGKYIALYINIEAAQPLRNDIVGVNELIISEFETNARIYLQKSFKPQDDCFQIRSMQNGVSDFLSRWCMELPKPLVVLMDEADALIGDGLLSVLRQLRAGYNKRPNAFPHALCLTGLRDIRDYRIYSDSSKRHIVGGSAFNIKDKSILLKNFTYEEIKDLYAQHTTETGQSFTPQAIQQIYYLTQGQPWLVNALGRELCFDEQAIDWKEKVTKADVDNAAEILIQRRDVHLDQLADKLTEPRVARIIEAILVGADNVENSLNEDQQYLIDLGLIRLGNSGLEIANPIYREIIPRELTFSQQNMLGINPQWYVKADGKLDIEKLLSAFIEFYKEHCEMLTKLRTYTEAAHHLLFMAWLQRIVNGVGHISREYAA
ncbi:MAG: ATP-binding protein, partial [Gammaproteobacteria bacterium]|nr:ATP-binding protein [Gammaproteobacteria bacterium]